MAPVKYPWDQWENGKWHTAVEGADFTCSVASFRAAVYGRAARDGLRAVVNVVDGHVEFCFYEVPSAPPPGPVNWCTRVFPAATRPPKIIRSCTVCAIPPVPCEA